MARIEFQLFIDAPVDLVYAVSQDYSVRYEWDPFPENIAFLNGATQIEAGVAVRVTAKNSLKMDVEFIQLAPPTTAAIKMIKGPWVLQQFSGSWIFKPHLKDQTNAKFVYAIKTKWWSIPYLSEFLVIWYFRKIIELRMQGLKRYCEAVISNSQERPMC